MMYYYSLKWVFFIVCISIVNAGVISDFFMRFGRRAKIPGLCPFVRALEPQDYLRHRAESAESRSFTEDSNRVATSADSNHITNERLKLTHLDDADDDFINDPKDSLCGSVCTSDKECGEGKKCCPTTCGYACYNPVYMIDDVLNNNS